MSRFRLALLGMLAFSPATGVYAQWSDPPGETYAAPLPESSWEVAPGPQDSQPPTLAPRAGLADSAGWASIEDGHGVGATSHVFSDRVPVEWLSDESTSEEMFDELSMEIESLDETPRIDWMADFLGYRYSEHSTDWIVGDGDQFGRFSLQADHYSEAGQRHGIGLGARFHFLGGPVRTDMPPRVFDFSVAGQWRKRIGAFGYDVAASVMASSDFEGSAREGIRYPAHAVGFWRINPRADLVFGVDYLDRGDLTLLPVGGLILTPNADMRLELVFPRPRVTFRLTDEHRLFVAGKLGGGSWAVERDGPFDDLATYRDLQLSVGLESTDGAGDRSAIEIGYVFDRSLEYASGIGDYRPNDTVIVRWVTNH